MNQKKALCMAAGMALALLAALCACAPSGEQTQTAPSQEADPAIRSWNDVPWDEHMELDYAQMFAVDYFYGFKRITIDNQVYVVVPEGVDGPPFSDMPEDVTVLYQPLDHIYLQATAAMDCFRQLDAMDAITMSGTQAEGWYIPEARQAMEEDRILYAGKYSAPDYELIQSQGCGLALESTAIYHSPEVKEQLERMGIPVLVERSSYESHPLGRMEWIKLYGALLNREEQAKAYFDQALHKLEPALAQEGTGKTVAFFSITSAGAVTVRRSGDYIAKAIDLAGGIYVPRGLPEEESALSTMNIQMETFYNEAKEADILIYNSTIEADLETIEQLVAKSEPLADFKAVRSGNVWCTGKRMFQESQSVGAMILDIHNILALEQNADGSLTYLYRLK